MAAKLRVGSIPAARSRPRERPLSARLARCPRYHEDPLTEPTAGAQPCRRERVLVPTIRTLLRPIRYRRVERTFGIGLLRPREAARRARLPTSRSTPHRSLRDGGSRSARRRAGPACPRRCRVASTLAPSATKASAVARPIPCAAAVTRARLPASRPAIAPNCHARRLTVN
jgi:hypothetical protein